MKLPRITIGTQGRPGKESEQTRVIDQANRLQQRGIPWEKAVAQARRKIRDTEAANRRTILKLFRLS